MIGEELGNFRILELLGEGGMGVVYKGVDTSLDRLVAIKVLNPDLSRNPELVDRFRAEARAHANLNHTNITTLYAFVAQAGQAWMVMEYIEGETITQMLQRRGLLPGDVAVPLFKQALLGIGWAHRMGIVHRDIKPSNLMVNRQGIVKVMDFGIAKVMGSGRGLTRTGTALGTAYYMSPEQVMNQPVDIRSDIYALGVTLYEMLTANVPFQGESDFQIMTAQVHIPPPAPTRHYPYIAKGTENAVLKALSKDPAARFQTVEEFGAALEHPNDFGVFPSVVDASITGIGLMGRPVQTPVPQPPPATPYPPPMGGGRVVTAPPMATPPPPTGPGFVGHSVSTPPPTPPPPFVSAAGAGPLPPPPSATRMETPPPVGTPPPLAPGVPLFGTTQRKLIAGAAALLLVAGIAALNLKKHPVDIPQVPQGGGGTSVHEDKKQTEVTTVWPPAPPDNAPAELKIVEFASDAKRVAAGQTAHLRWSVQGATEITISPQVGAVEPMGSKEVVVQRTTQFVLTAKKLGGEEVHQEVVVEAGTSTPEAPRRLEVAFAAQPETITAGQSTQLRWSVPGAEVVAIAPAIGRVPAAGSVTVKPAQTTTYQLQARTGTGVTGGAEVTVQVQPAQEAFKPATPAKPEISFEATPNTISSGGSATLSWSLRNAVAATITPQPGVLRQTSGKIAVSPASTTTYVLTARSKDNVTGTATAVVTVTASTAPPARSGSAMITVVHDHGGAANVSAWPSCYGALQVVNGVLRYAVAGSVDGRTDGFEVPVGQIQEVKLNLVRVRNQPAFHVTVRGRHLNFVATGMTAAQAVTEIEAAMPRR